MVTEGLVELVFRVYVIPIYIYVYIDIVVGMCMCMCMYSIYVNDDLNAKI